MQLYRMMNFDLAIVMNMRERVRECVEGAYSLWVSRKSFVDISRARIFNLEAYVNSKLAYAFVRNTCTHSRMFKRR